MFHTKERQHKIILSSFSSLVIEFLLALTEIILALLIHSTGVLSDATSTFGGALSAGLTLLGAKLSGKTPDKRHPFGYGRIEYLVTFLISLIIIFIGSESAVHSIEKIIDPMPPLYSIPILGFLLFTIIIKIAHAIHLNHTAKEVKSSALSAIAKEALHHSYASILTVIGALLSLFADIQIEGIVGLIIAIYLIYEGVQLLIRHIRKLLGEQISPVLSSKIRDTILSFPDVQGAYDLSLHTYGPDRVTGSVHISVPDSWTVDRLDHLQRQIAKKVLEETGVILTGIGVYSINTKNDFSSHLESEITAYITQCNLVTSIHGFYYQEETQTISLDAVFSLKNEVPFVQYQQLKTRLQERYPQYSFLITMDVDALNQ